MSDSRSCECPFCHGVIQDKALKCKHCQALFLPDNHVHGGLCPFCKENIHPEAIKCMHCKTDLNPIPVTNKVVKAIDLEQIVFGN